MSVTVRAGHEVYARQLGEGPRDALLLHCSLAHSGAWKGLAARLGDAFSFMAYDQLDHGKSADWNGEGDYHDASTAVAASFLGDAPIDLIGHSFGATLALRLAVEQPRRVRSLVLIEPVFFAAAVADEPELAQAHDAQVSHMAQLIEAGDTHGAARDFLSVWGGGVPWEAMPEDAKTFMASRAHVIVDAEPALMNDTAGLLAEGRLGALEMPVLLLRGSASPAITKAINDALARRIRGAQSRVVSGAAHMLPITHPRETAQEIRAFYAL